MISRTRGIFSTNLWKPKNIHSLDYLKYLYTVLSKNQNISDQNKDLLVEVVRLIAEILIWGDQNDSAVIDFFLEKNILSFFLKYMNQKFGKLICNQLLQTLSIMFENISDNTSIYYLLSNNHINSIICHKFDFTDEEVMGYYISFLKALSMKLNKHTINFFYNEHTNDFALYTEAIKFFNQSESMVRTAVRIITLNVYKVADRPMLAYIRNKTAAPYFENLMWFIGRDIISVDSCLSGCDTNSIEFSRLQGLVDGHLDHMHYINDVLCLQVDLLNDILVDRLLNRLLIPLYVYSLTKRRPYSLDADPRPHISYIVSLFLLTQVFLIIKYPSVVRPLSRIILTGDLSCCINEKASGSDTNNIDEKNDQYVPLRERKFVAPLESLAQTLDNIQGSARPRSKEIKSNTVEDYPKEMNQKSSLVQSVASDDSTQLVFNSAPVTPRHRYNSLNSVNECGVSKNENNDHIFLQSHSLDIPEESSHFTLEGKPFLKAVFRALEIGENNPTSDYDTLFALGLIFAICQNQGVDECLLLSLGLTSKSKIKTNYNKSLLDKLICIINSSVKYGSPIRLPTLELACVLVEILVCSRHQSYVSDEHYAFILAAHEESILLLRNYYKSEEVFVDMFDDEVMNLRKKPLNVEFLMMDSKILLPSNSKLHDAGDFNKKLPSTDIERARYAIRVFLLLRQLCDKLKTHDEDVNKVDLLYPFNTNIISVGEKLDLNHKDLVACTIERNGRVDRRFLVNDEYQIILVEPDSKKVGWGVVAFVGFLQHIKLSSVKDDNRSLFIEIYNHASAIALKSTRFAAPMLSARFIFDDHIRCMVARKRLEKGRERAQELKLQEIALMLDFPTNVALGIKPSQSNTTREYCSGYYGPKDFVSDTSSQKRSSPNVNLRLTINDFDRDMKSNISSQKLSSTSDLSMESNHFN